MSAKLEAADAVLTDREAPDLMNAEMLVAGLRQGPQAAPAKTAALAATDAVLSDAEAWALWAAEMAAQGLRPRTFEARQRILLGSFASFLRAPVVTAQRADLVRFLGQARFSNQTRQNYRSALRMFFTFMQDEGYRLDNPALRLPRPRVIRPEPDPFTTDEVQRLLDSGIYGRTRVMVLLASLQGFRAVEIAAVRGENIRWDDQMILTAEAKNGHEVWRPLHPLVLTAAQTMPREGFWFPARVGKDNKQLDYSRHVLPNSVSNVIGQAIRRAGLGHHRGHQLRAWHATELLDAGVDTTVVQHSMRHASAQTLHRYIRPNPERIRTAMEQLPDLVVPTKTNRVSRSAA